MIIEFVVCAVLWLGLYGAIRVWGKPDVGPGSCDLFSGAGGAAMGYSRAGFDVVGVDIEPQPNYPFEFHQDDAMTWPLDGFDVIHASPPCQGYSRMRHLPWLKGNEYPLLIDAVRERLQAAGVPWVLRTSKMPRCLYSTVLCGQTFGLPIYRHRRFGSSEADHGPRSRSPHQDDRTGRLLGDRGRISSWERQTCDYPRQWDATG